MEPVLKRCRRGKELVKFEKKRDHQSVDKGQAIRARTTGVASLFLLLPIHLIYDILSRLPVYSLFICKRVCNTFKSIFPDPYFAQLHLSKASRNDCSLVIQDGDYPSKLFLTPLLDLDNHAVYSNTSDRCDGKYLSWHTVTTPPSIPNTMTFACLIGSCNGLLCLRYFLQKDKVVYFCVCNPVLGEFTLLPQFMKFTLELGGFGFCPKTKKYKVLRFIPEFRCCDIITLGWDDDWRRISDTPPLPDRVVDLDSSFEGNIHWIFEHCRPKKSICSFNLETERHSYLSLPSCFENTNLRLYSLYIGTLEGLFCISLMLVTGHFEVFVMEDYGVSESWIKRVSIDTRYSFGDYNKSIATVSFLDNGVLVLKSPTHLIYHCTRNGTTSNILVKGDYSAMIHIASLKSLKDIAGRENVEEGKVKMSRIYSSKARRCRRK